MNASEKEMALKGFLGRYLILDQTCTLNKPFDVCSRITMKPCSGGKLREHMDYSLYLSFPVLPHSAGGGGG